MPIAVWRLHAHGLHTKGPLEGSLEVLVLAMGGLVDVMYVGVWPSLRWGLCPFGPYLLFESVAAPVIPDSALVVSTCVSAKVMTHRVGAGYPESSYCKALS